MADNIITAAGPLFGPDFVEVVANDDTGRQYTVQVYPDASNAELKAAGLPTQYYWQPARITVAHKEDRPEDFDFGMTVFKGLMTSEDTIGITDTMTTDGTVAAGGGFCTFTTTMALPDSVITNVIRALKASAHPAPMPRLASCFFRFRDDDPDPRLGVIPITEANVTIEVPQLAEAGGNPKAPMFIGAQGNGKGSIEAHGFNSWLVTCNQLAAGAVAGSLKAGISPFTFHCDLKELVYIHGCQITVTVDVDKTYDQFSAALSVGGFLGIDNASMEWAYSRMQTSGAITTHIQMDGADVTPELQQWIERNVDDMRRVAIDTVKQEIFDWTPTEQAPATAQRGLFSSIFGGASVSLKASHQKRGVKLDQQLVLDSTIAVHNVISGDLNDLEPAVKAHLDRYLAEVDIGEFFKMVQVAAVSAINFNEPLPDGTNLRDPIESVSLEVSYPDFSAPGGDGQPLNLQTRAQGFHYTIGHKDPNGATELATWSRDDPRDVINISFLRLSDPPREWPANQVGLRKTIVYDGADPRVDLANGTSQMVLESTTEGHAPKLSADEVGYVHVRFVIGGTQIPPNVTVTLRATIGARTDTLTATAANQRNLLWEIWSDKYVEETEFSYTMEVSVAGSGFLDEPVTWSTPTPVRVPISPGRLKYLSPLTVAIPRPTPEQLAQANAYIKDAITAATPPPQFPAVLPPGGLPLPMPAPTPS